jgi:hypothetical protein
VTATQFVANGASTVPNLILNGPSTTWTRYQTSGTDRWDVGNNVGGLSSNQFSFYSNGANSNVFVIQQNGNVGIGTASPLSFANTLTVHMNGGSNGSFFTMAGSGTRYLTILAQSGEGKIETNTAIPLILATNEVERMRITSGGNVSIGNTNDTFKLDVSGDGRFTDNLLVEKGQNITTKVEAKNTTIGTISDAAFIATSDSSAGQTVFGKKSSGVTTYKILTQSSAYWYNGTAGDISIINDFSSGAIKLAAGGSSSANLTIASTGAATFSNALQVAGQQAAANYGGTGLNFDFTSSNAGRIASVKTTSGGSSLELHTYTTSGADNTALTISNTGAATFSSSVTAGGTITLNAPSANYATLNLNGAAGYGAELKFGEATGGYLAAIRHNYNVGTGLEFYTNGLSSGNLRMYIAPSGNVGIGTTNPTAKIQISSTSAGAATVAAFLLNESVTTNTEVRLAFAANTNNEISSNRYSYISAINTSGSNGQALVFATNETANSAVERLRITSGGNVGIGTTSPPTKFAVKDGTDTVLQYYASGADGYLGMGNEAGSIGAGGKSFNLLTGTQFTFSTGGTERMTITSGGAVEMTGSVKTGAPSGYTAKPYKLGEVLSGGTTATHTVAVEIDGVVYFLLAASSPP